ncbi:MAG: hypothetical protein JNK63_07975 [Chthonomonas sp.]|nr:hypothetical protein [Chthonomonas sp.]
MTRDALLELQDYDRWANQKWLAALDGMPDPAVAKQIFAHILVAQHKWLAVVLSEEEVAPLEDDLELAIARLFDAWRDVILHGDPNAFVSHERDGQSYFYMLSEVAHHMFNHGTYHRGHLRGLADAEGFEDFPETDMIKFTREKARQ